MGQISSKEYGKRMKRNINSNASSVFSAMTFFFLAATFYVSSVFLLSWGPIGSDAIATTGGVKESFASVDGVDDDEIGAVGAFDSRTYGRDSRPLEQKRCRGR